jgi:dihydroorotase
MPKFGTDPPVAAHIPTRREFSKYLLASSIVSATASDSWSASMQLGSDRPDCDLLIKGGTVVDPSQNLHALLDVAVKEGKILEVSADIPVNRAATVVYAKGKLVTPGLIDVHVHVFEGVGASGVSADVYCLGRGVTTVVDTGSAGYAAIAGLRKYVIKTSQTRIFALVDIGGLGVLVGLKDSLLNLNWVNPELTARAADDNKPDVVGIKVRLTKDYTGSNDLEILARAVKAAEISRLPLMVHIGDSYSPLPAILSRMRKGDVITHCYTSLPNGFLDANGKILPEVKAARERGIFFDVGAGTFYLDFEVAQKCLEQGFLPDTISSDLASSSIKRPTFDLVTTLSKFLLLGLNMDQVIERVTVAPTRLFNFGVELGTLRPGQEADVTVLETREGTLFLDQFGKNRKTHQKLVSAAAIRHGQLCVNRSEELVDN